MAYVEAKNPQSSKHRIHLNFKSLLESGENSDFSIFVGPDEVEFKVHKLIIGHNSNYLKRVSQSSSFREGQEGKLVLPDFDEVSFGAVMEWLYSGQIHNLDRMKTERLHEIAEYAEYFGVESLKTTIQSLLDAPIEALKAAPLKHLIRPKKKDRAPVKNAVSAALQHFASVHFRTDSQDMKQQSVERLFTALRSGAARAGTSTRTVLGYVCRDEVFQKVLGEDPVLKEIFSKGVALLESKHLGPACHWVDKNWSYSRWPKNYADYEGFSIYSVMP